MKKYFLILFASLIIWILSDVLVTKILDLRGFSLFFQFNKNVGHMNKINFSGNFGGPLDQFMSSVNIGNYGERVSTKSNCKNKTKILFLGDSFLAGFEVNDDETFVSLINKNCKINNFNAYNFGVRAYDTHHILGTYERLRNKYDFDYVFYLISDNDLYENLKQSHYPNLVKKFGRIYNGVLYKPELNIIEKMYFNFRIFVSDNLYFTTKLILYSDNLKNIINFPNNDNDLSNKKNIDTDNQILKFVQLSLKLNQKITSDNKKLFLAFIPCFSENCSHQLDIEDQIINKLKSFDKIEIFDFKNQFEEMVSNKKIIREQMYFINDYHFSKYGHKIMYEMIVRNLMNF